MECAIAVKPITLRYAHYMNLQQSLYSVFSILSFCSIINLTIGGATPKFLGGPNLLPTTDVLQAMTYKPQHWDWAQTEITSPIFTH